jgi:putative serine protease PepD
MNLLLSLVLLTASPAPSEADVRVIVDCMTVSPRGFEFYRAYGSGALVSDRYVITCDHVVADLSPLGSVYVVFNDFSWVEAEVVATHKGGDVATLKIPPTNRRPYILNPCFPLNGVNLTVKGFDGGLFDTTTGVVDNTEYLIEGDETHPEGHSRRYPTEFIIDSAKTARPGDSGGAVVDMNGNLVGVITSIYPPEEESYGTALGIYLSRLKGVRTVSD